MNLFTLIRFISSSICGVVHVTNRNENLKGDTYADLFTFLKETLIRNFFLKFTIIFSFITEQVVIWNNEGMNFA